MSEEYSKVNIDGYEAIASDYYQGYHPTSRNFDCCSTWYFDNNTVDIPSDGLVIELGSGTGQSSRYCKVKPNRIIQTDASMSMLELQPREFSKVRVRCNAIDLPFPDEMASCITAFLYDPFNVPRLYSEIARVLVVGGMFVGTLPHVVWGSALRNSLGIDIDLTMLVTEEGEAFQFPSYLMEVGSLYENMARNNIDLVSATDVCLPKNTEIVSPHVELAAINLDVPFWELPLIQVVVGRRVR